MKILLVLETDWINRGPAQHHHLLERLKERGHNIRVIDFNILWSEKKGKWPWSKKRQISVKGKVINQISIRLIRPFMIHAPIICYASFIPSYIIELIRQIKVYKPDVIIGEGLLNVFLATRIAKLFKIPLIKYFLDSDYNLIPEKFLRPLGFWLEIQGIKNSNEILVINKQLCNYAKRMGAVAVPQVLSAGVDRQRFNPEISGESVRERLGFGNNETVLFFMGWLYHFSGLRELAKSMIALTDKRIRLLILGRGDLYTELKQMAKHTKVANIITIVDWVEYSDVPHYIAAADICLLPALLNKTMRDIVPIKLYEYLACGKPVIATRLPGIWTEFGSKNGIRYIQKPEEVYNLARKIPRNSDEYMHIREEAISFMEKLDWESITNHFEKILEDVIS